MLAPIYRLLLETGYEMNLEDTLYLLSIYRNLISLSRLDVSEYSALFSCGKLNLLFNSITVGYVTLYDNLYETSLYHKFAQSLIALCSGQKFDPNQDDDMCPNYEEFP